MRAVSVNGMGRSQRHTASGSGAPRLAANVLLLGADGEF
jgi:hypothetical protein